MAAETYRYRAFISYRHVERDRKWARWLIEKLETYRTPRALVRAGTPARIGHLYRDDDEVPASSDLSHEIENSLRESQFLIVVCSPDTPKSKWVHREIEFFRSLGRGDRILALLVAGEPSESFPPNLLRVAVEARNPDGSHTTEWIEREPIASDVRPRSDERRGATERRAFLRIAAGLLGVGYDDLVRREHQRRLLSQRIRMTGAVTAAAICAAAAATYYDYNSTKILYYADFGTKYGVPYGIGELDREQVSRRLASYEIKRRHWRVQSVRRINWFLKPAPLEGNGADAEGWDKDVAEWSIGSYDEAGRAAEIDVFGEDEARPLRKERYDWDQVPGSAIVSFTGSRGSSSALGAGAFDLETLSDWDSLDDHTGGLSGVSRHWLFFDASGRVKKRLYLAARDARGEGALDGAIADRDGSFGRTYEYTPRGQIARVRSLDKNGQMLTNGRGVAEIRRYYSASGDLVRAEWRTSDDRPAINSHGYSVLNRHIYDAAGGAAVSYWADDHPVDNQDLKAASEELWITENGHRMDAEYFDADHKPTLMSAGFAMVSEEIEDDGHSVLVKFKGKDGRLIAIPGEGFAQLRMSDIPGGFEYRLFGIDSQPVASPKSGVYGFRIRSESNRRVSDYLDARGKPMSFKGSSAVRVITTFDDTGHVVDERFFDKKGVPAPWPGSGVPHITYGYALDGSSITVDYLDKSGSSKSRKDLGIARIEEKFERGREVEDDYYDERHELSDVKDCGYAIARFSYDDHGRRTRLEYFNSKKNPAARDGGGVSSETIQFDARGFPKELDAWGIHHERVINPDWSAARITAEYVDGEYRSGRRFDAANNEIKGPATPPKPHCQLHDSIQSDAP
jgi:hypothetical protein